MSDHASIDPVAGSVASSDAARIAGNFGKLLGQAWESGVIGELVGSVLLWGAVLMVVGCVGGYLVWRCAVRRRACEVNAARWATALLLPAVFVVFAAIGAGYGGLWFGWGRTVRHYVVERRVVEKAVVFGIGAVALDEAGVKLTGDETPADLDALFADAERIRLLSAAEFDRRVREYMNAAATPDEGLIDRLFRRLAARFVADRIVADLFDQTGLDARVIVMMVADPAGIERLKLEQPDLSTKLALGGNLLSRLSAGAMKLVNAVVYTNLAAGVAIGLIGPWVLVAVALRVVARKAEPVDEVGRSIERTK